MSVQPPNGSSNAFVWPEEGLNAVPDWLYTSDEIYQRELERIFYGPTWNYVALEAEIPNHGDYKRSWVGEAPVIVTRGADGNVHVVENRCAHRGAEFCRSLTGNSKEFICPYHQWTYDLDGSLRAVPFRRGVKGKGGMPADFKLSEHGLRKLRVATRNGVVFASYADHVEPLDQYIGPEILKDFDTLFDGRPLKILGYWRNTLYGNWKLYHENLKDPYHATLLHTFLVTFGLMKAGQKSAMIADPLGRHGTMASAKGDEEEGVDQKAVNKEMRKMIELELEDGRVVGFVPEFKSPWTVTMQTIWPNFITQRELNTLGVRHIVPRGPDSIDMYWTMFGYADDTEEMTKLRLCQSNLMGPAGFLGIEDNEAIKWVQEGARRSVTEKGLTLLGGRDEGTSDTLITEAAVRSMYRYYRGVMGL
ncbi:MAG: Rieske 2Fe-2S domain-containing protein [Alphaproteobacteria bacterium]|nr:Rieske 2Fe-2S domain-containing protein [Alphaproteobacteria bacterium]